MNCKKCNKVLNNQEEIDAVKYGGNLLKCKICRIRELQAVLLKRNLES